MHDLLREFVQLNEKYNTYKKMLNEHKRRFGSVVLYPSEIHTLVYIVDHPDNTFSQVAKGLCVTKGALTKLIAKIEQKELIEKYAKEGNKKSVYFKPTDLGWESYKAHEAFHQKYEVKTTEAFDTYLEQNEKVISEFFVQATQVLDQLNEIVEEVEENGND